MNILANIYDKKNNSISYIYEDNNKYYGYVIKDGYKCNIKGNVLKNIYNIIKVNDNCKYVYSENEYEIYYDELNDLKHYLKNGMEDLKQFFLSNGEDSLLYLKSNNDSNNRLKSFVINGIIYFISITLIETIGIELVLNSDIFPMNEVVYMMENIKDYNPDVLFNKYEKINKITVDECIRLIQNSPCLLDSEKKYFCNTDFLNFIFNYYDDSNMKYILNNRLTDLKICYFKQNNINEGYYNSLEHNILYVSDNLSEEEKKGVFSHEYIHVFQGDYVYKFFSESVAELLNHEFFDVCNYSHYLRDVTTLKLLIQTIGKDAILKTTFSGDDSELLEILSNYLNKSDLNKMLKLLKTKPKNMNNKESDQLRYLISVLYNNIYHKNMFDDPSIIYELLYEAENNWNKKSEIYYFNSEKMQTTYLVDVDSNLSLLNNFITTDGEIEIFQRVISKADYLRFKNKSEQHNIGKIPFDKVEEYINLEDYLDYLDVPDVYENNAIYVEWIYSSDSMKNRKNFPIHLKTKKYLCKFGGYVMGDRYYFKAPNYQLKFTKDDNSKVKIKVKE